MGNKDSEQKTACTVCPRAMSGFCQAQGLMGTSCLPSGASFAGLQGAQCPRGGKHAVWSLLVLAMGFTALPPSTALQLDLR